MKLRDTCSLEERLYQPRQQIKKQRHYFAYEAPYSQSYGLPSSHVWMWESDYKESWAPKNWWFWIVVLEKALESPLDCKEIQPFHPKGDQSWVFIGRTDAEAETPILWPPDVKIWFIRKDRNAGKDWKQEAKGTTEGKMVGWHHWLHGHESEQDLGDGEGQGSLVCCSPWGCKESDKTEQLNSNLYPQKWKYVHTKICSLMFTATLYTIAKTGSNSNVLPTGQWINKLYTYHRLLL